jgi:PTH2 family peptidyl-tRNA hydrolase
LAAAVVAFVAGWLAHLAVEHARRHAGGDAEDVPGPRRPAQGRRPPPRRVTPPSEELRLILVVNEGLKMGKGKTGAQVRSEGSVVQPMAQYACVRHSRNVSSASAAPQCAHAAVGIFERLILTRPRALAAWKDGGEAKICLRASDEAELRALATAAQRANLVTFSVHDAGRTQVAAGSHTVLAIGPASRSALDGVTGHLKLL